MKKKYFGTDGIRGKVGSFPITQTFFFKLAISLARSKKNIKKIIIGKDTRLSGSLLENALLNGFDSVNIEGDFIGVVSTPILSFYTNFLRYDYGIMISASHNPYYDNGIKIFKKNGEKLNDREEIKIEEILDSLKIKPNIRKKKIVNKTLNFESYKKGILKKFSQNNFRTKVVLDCANGSVSQIAPRFFKGIGCDVIKYSSKPNGVNINKNCGAMYPKKIARLTRQNKADIGLSFDGDADRVIISDEKGQVLDGDVIIAAIVKYYGSKKQIKSIVGTYMCNLGFREYLKKLKVRLYLTKVGDRYVIQKMKQAKVKLGGEQSGHIIFSDNGYCGDGILTAMFIINTMSEQKIKLSELTENLFLKSYQKLINMKIKINSEKIIKHKEINKVLKNFKIKYKNLDYLIRRSGTENLLRVMVQSKNKNEGDEVLKVLVNLVKKLDD
tara:strand:- start:1686 stop:3008 length:1323 start_codon:yes stop_codon:yes gene_type:complete